MCAGAALAGCSQHSSVGSPAPTAAVPVADAQATKELALYRTLQQQQSWELAAPIGNEIIARFPGSAVAREVQETLLDTNAKAKAIATRRRLERLWFYGSGTESGAAQNTASIYSNDIAVADRVRLILRRHAAWGQSVYLFGSGKGFECRGTCRLNARFDDKPPVSLKAYLPPTGEPALLISDDAGFIKRLGTAQAIAIDVTGKGRKPRTLVFDVGGFDAARFPPLPHGAKARKPDGR
jgi:hypothetical protein